MHTRKTRKVPPAHVLRELSVGTADPRTIKKFLRGGAVAPMTRERIVKKLASSGLGHLVPQSEGA